jgi:hydrogenase-4 component E
MHLAQFPLSQSLPTQAPGVFTGGANVIAVLILLAEFGMLRQALLRDHIRLYIGQSALIAVLAVIVAAARHISGLYVLAALTVAVKVIVIPLLLRRLLRETGPGSAQAGGPDIAGSGGLGAASTVLLAIVVAAFGFFAAGRLGIRSNAAPVTALSVSMSVVLVAFVLMICRRDVVSQAIGLFSLENGISLAALVVAASLPLILEVALLFDLLLAVVVFGLLIRMHHGRARSLSTTGLTRLRG